MDPTILAADRIGFGLRKNEGIPIDSPLIPSDPTPLRDMDIWSWLKELEPSGLAEISEDRLKLTLDGRLVADAIAGQVLERM